MPHFKNCWEKSTFSLEELKNPIKVTAPPGKKLAYYARGRGTMSRTSGGKPRSLIEGPGFSTGRDQLNATNKGKKKKIPHEKRALNHLDRNP